MEVGVLKRVEGEVVCDAGAAGKQVEMTVVSEFSIRSRSSCIIFGISRAGPEVLHLVVRSRPIAFRLICQLLLLLLLLHLTISLASVHPHPIFPPPRPPSQPNPARSETNFLTS